MSSSNKKFCYDATAAATAQYYNSTGIVPASFQLPFDISYLVTTQPNCTIVVFKLPLQCTEIELRNIFSSYGPVKNMQIVCDGKAALIEYNDISLPTRLVHWAKINPFYIGMTHVRLEFSSQTITKNNSYDSVSQHSEANQSFSQILHLDITNAEYPITVDVIKSICSPYGQLQRIFIGKKSVDKSVEALVEFSDGEHAKNAKENLEGADIYSGCCSLSVNFSKLKKVHVTKNDTESWDFTESKSFKKGLLDNITGQRTLLAPIPSTKFNAATPAALITAPATTQHSMVSSSHQSYCGYVAPQAYATQYISQVGSYASSYQNQMRPYGMGATSQSSYYPSSVGYQILPQAYPPFTQVPTQSILQISRVPSDTHHVTPDGIGIGHSSMSTDNATTSVKTEVDAFAFQPEEGAVLLVSNLPVRMNCDRLFNALCLYGNIARIKFLKSRLGYALIQMGSKESADNVFSNLDGVKVFGHIIQFHHSKQIELQEQAGLGTLQDGSPVMKNYMSDSNNRFRTATLVAKSRIITPTRTLHFYNSPLYLTLADMCLIFTNCGVKSPPRMVIFTSKPGQKTSLGLVEWDTLGEAMDALSLANHRPIYVIGSTHPFHMKLAFSPKPISPDRAGNCMINYPAPPLTSSEYYSPSSQGFNFQPHTVFTVASSLITNKPSSCINASANYLHNVVKDGENTLNEFNLTSTLDVEKLEAEESEFLVNLTSPKITSHSETKISTSDISARPIILSTPESSECEIRLSSHQTSKQPISPPSETQGN